jgi:hypothetical protein
MDDWSAATFVSTYSFFKESTETGVDLTFSFAVTT